MSSISTSTFRQELPISPATCLTDAYSSSTTSSQNLGAPSAKVEFYTYVDAFLYVPGATLTTIFPLALPVFSFCIACGAGSNESRWPIIVLPLMISTRDLGWFVFNGIGRCGNDLNQELVCLWLW